MIKKVTVEWLVGHGACNDALRAWWHVDIVAGAMIPSIPLKGS